MPKSPVDLRRCQPGPGAGVDRWSKIIQGLLLPPRCLLCLDRGQWPVLDLCAECTRHLPRNDPACAGCALPLPAALAGMTLCGRCQQEAPPFQRVVAPFRYEWPVAAMIQHCKYHRELPHGRVLGTLLAAAVADRAVTRPTLLPVPLHRDRELQRGFNQAELIATTVGRELGLPVARRVLCRTRATAAQAGLSAHDRVANVRGAFALARPLPPGPLVIVDDVMTTGNTITEIAMLLANAGATQVEVWVIARAG